jgi:hypothetical protein
MKMRSVALRSSDGFTFAEMMIATAIMVVVGICIYQVTTSGTILYAKNTAINVAHDQSRIAVSRLVHDIHAAVSVPQLGHIDPRAYGTWAAPTGSWKPYGTSVTFAADTGTGPSAGVAFQVLGGSNGSPGGPWNVSNDPASSIIMIASEPYMPQVGQRLILPY